jgi:hypothetical protein
MDNFKKPHLNVVRVKNPTNVTAQLYQRVEIDGEIKSLPSAWQVTDIDGVPYKVIQWDQDIATCQECTVEEVADLAMQWASGKLKKAGPAEGGTWTDQDLDQMAEITPEDLANAGALWDSAAPEGLKGLLDAGSGEGL